MLYIIHNNVVTLYINYDFNIMLHLIEYNIVILF